MTINQITVFLENKAGALLDVTKLLSENKEKFDKVVEFLLENESMTGAQFTRIMCGQEAGEATSAVMFDLPENE